MVAYVKAVHGNIGFDGHIIREGQYKRVEITQNVELLINSGKAKAFKTAEEAKNYKFIRASRKALTSLEAFQRPMTKEGRPDESFTPPEGLVDDRGDPTPLAAKIEEEQNPDIKPLKVKAEDVEEEPKAKAGTKKK